MRRSSRVDLDTILFTRRKGMDPIYLCLATELRAIGLPYVDIAREFRRRFPTLSAMTALRLAHGWSQRDAAAAWSRRWPDDIKTFKNMSYWEHWPNPAGYTPRTANLFRLAQLLCCRIADLVDGAGDFRHLDPQYEQAVLFDVCRSCGQFAPAPWDSTVDALRRLAEVRRRLAVRVRDADSALQDLDDLPAQAAVWAEDARKEMIALVALLA